MGSKRMKLDSRKADEKAEGMETVTSDVSSEKFQATQQVVNPVEEATSAKPGKGSFNRKQLDTKGHQLKQEAVAEVITGVGGVSSPTSQALSGSGLKSLAYSGNLGTILGSAADTPVVDTPSRSNTRPGQKMDAIVKQIDFVASEQVLQKFDGSVPLQNDPDAVQGFLGHPENDNARGQKIAEAVPGGLLYQRSVDEICNDQVVYANGQTIRERGVEYKYEPTVYVDESNNLNPYTVKRGNFVPKALRIGISSTTGRAVAITYDVDDISCDEVSYDVANESASHFVRDMNTHEINRQNMESEAGVETKDNWTPLARGVQQPTPTVGFLTDDEILTGTEDWMAYRFINKAFGYLLNKVGKDGQLPYRTFKEMLFGYARAYNDSSDIQDNETDFNAVDYLHGSPSLMIPLYDSINKYSKRGDLFTQPRSWKMHKQTADNNINQFRLKPGFAAYVNAIDTFSTIDRPYDPLLPVCITDGFRVAHSYNWDKLYRRQGYATYVFKMKGKGALQTAVGAFEDYLDDTYSSTNHTAVSDTLGVLKHWNSTSSSYDSGSIYDHFYSFSGEDSRKASKTIVAAIGTDFSTLANAKASRYETLEQGLEAATTLIDSVGFKHDTFNNAYICLFAVEGTGADDVYAAVVAPNLYVQAEEAGVYIAHSTTGDNLLPDRTADMITVLHNSKVLPCFAYSYHNRQNPYYVQVKNPLLYGVAEWVDNVSAKMLNPSVSRGTSSVATASNAAGNQGIIWYYIPIAHYTRQMSLWDLIVCASIPYQQKIRTNSQMDTLAYLAANGHYPYPQIKEIGELNPLASANYSNHSFEKPLEYAVMKPSTAIRWVLPEKFWRVRHANTNSVVTDESFVLPFYFSEEQFNITHDTSGNTISIIKDVDGHVMNYPTVRAGGRWAYTDLFFGMKERDIRLCLDRLTVIPGGDQTSKSDSKAGVYKYSLSNSGIPVVNYDSTGGMLTQAVFMRTPREIGWGFTAPLGYVTPATNEYLVSSGNHVYNVSPETYSYSMHRYMSEGSSFRIRAWRVHDGAEYGDINDPQQLVINRAGNFAQDWREQCDAIYAPYGSSASTLNYGLATYFYPERDIGVALSMSDAICVNNGSIVGVAGDSLFNPFTYGGNTGGNAIATIITLQKPLWAKIQCLPFALSPFDQTPAAKLISDNTVVTDATIDPYDLMITFGYCGYKGSDYREDVYNRIYERQTLGWLFKDDPFELASPIMRDGGFSGR